LRRERALLLSHERPDFVDFDVLQGQALEPGIHVPLARVAEFDHELHDRCPVNASQTGGRPERIALDQVVQNFDLLLSGEDVGHGEIPFCLGSR